MIDLTDKKTLTAISAAKSSIIDNVFDISYNTGNEKWVAAMLPVLHVKERKGYVTYAHY